MKASYTAALVLIIIGGINWGLVGFFDYNLVEGLFGVETFVTRLIYGLVGLAAIWSVVGMVYKTDKE